MARLLEIGPERVLAREDEGPAIADVKGWLRIIEEAMEHRATVIAVPVARLDASFFTLRSGLAGEILQKAANYGFKVAIVGDISEHVGESDALRDFVVECNRGRSIFFADDVERLEQRLRA